MVIPIIPLLTTTNAPPISRSMTGYDDIIYIYDIYNIFYEPFHDRLWNNTRHHDLLGRS